MIDIKKIEAAIAAVARNDKKDLSEYKAYPSHIYIDSQGKLIYVKSRYKHHSTGDKWIRSFHFDEAGKLLYGEPDFNKAYPEGGGKKPLYQRPDILQSSSEPVYFFEGEHKAELAKQLGFIGTTTGGASTVDKHYLEPVRGRKVHLWPDYDEAGGKWLQSLYPLLKALDCEISVINASELGIPEKGDIVDWVELQKHKAPDITDDDLSKTIKKLPTYSDEQLENLYHDDSDKSSSSIISHDGQAVTPAQAQAIIDELAQLTELEYTLKRSEVAKLLGMPSSSLDKFVKQVRNELDDDKQASLIPSTDPYSEAVNGAELADEIKTIIAEHIACTDAVVIASTLWIFFTWAIDVSYIAPIAWINAPEKRCGKSQLLTLLARMSKGAFSVSNISPSALFRFIEKYKFKTTLFIDEADTFINNNEDLRGVLNAGHSLDNPYIIRCSGDDNEPTAYFVYGAKAISGIGKIPNTLMDRSISLTLRRMLKSERRKRVRDLPRHKTDLIKEKLARWADDNMEAIEKAKPELPDVINDRMQDNWEILLKVASVLGEDWLAQANQACIEISGIEHDEPSLNEQLLKDIKSVFELKKITRISSMDLIATLCSDPEMNWATYNRGKPITPKQVSNRLGEYKISSKSLRVSGQVTKGYDLNDFKDAFARYLADTPSLSVTELQASKHKGYSGNTTVTTSESVTDKKLPEALNSLECNRVTDRIPNHAHLPAEKPRIVEGKV